MRPVTMSYGVMRVLMNRSKEIKWVSNFFLLTLSKNWYKRSGGGIWWNVVKRKVVGQRCGTYNSKFSQQLVIPTINITGNLRQLSKRKKREKMCTHENNNTIIKKVAKAYLEFYCDIS